MVAKKGNPDYKQILAHVHKDVVLKFKVKLASEQKEQSEVIEELIKKWVAEKE
jgi:D-ribose pyranose/furanose isomerase RbsD